MGAPQNGRTPLLPGALHAGLPATLGVMGGGQLGRMFVQAAQRLGYASAVLDPDPASPAGALAHHHIRRDYLDPEGLAQLTARCAAITTEFENVPAAALRSLAAQRVVAPGADAVAIAQDRRLEKAHFTRAGVPVAPHAVINTEADLARVPPTLLPGVLKTACLGYDGKGQASVQNADQLRHAWLRLGGVPCVLEQRLALALECSVVLARGADGACVTYPPLRNVHRDGILALTELHAQNLPLSLAQQAQDAAKSIAAELAYVGVLCVEFFVLADSQAAPPALGRLVVNEMAPRPHNSGHVTMDACDVSQFELQVRTLAGLPLVTPRLHSPAVMLNLLGDLWPADATPAWDRVLALPGAHLHLYGKLSARAGRKMGHLTLTAASADQAWAKATQAAQLLGLSLP